MLLITKECPEYVQFVKKVLWQIRLKSKDELAELTLVAVNAGISICQ
jgi:hypothetical protein